MLKSRGFPEMETLFYNIDSCLKPNVSCTDLLK